MKTLGGPRLSSYNSKFPILGFIGKLFECQILLYLFPLNLDLWFLQNLQNAQIGQFWFHIHLPSTTCNLSIRIPNYAFFNSFPCLWWGEELLWKVGIQPGNTSVVFASKSAHILVVFLSFSIFSSNLTCQPKYMHIISICTHF